MFTLVKRSKYTEDIVRRLGLENCNCIKNPMVPGDNRLTKQEDGKRVDVTLFK